MRNYIVYPILYLILMLGLFCMIVGLKASVKDEPVQEMVIEVPWDEQFLEYERMYIAVCQYLFVHEEPRNQAVTGHIRQIYMAIAERREPDLTPPEYYLDEVDNKHRVNPKDQDKCRVISSGVGQILNKYKIKCTSH